MQPENSEAKRRLPNVLVTGTPGTGKSTTCEQIAEATGLCYVNVGDLVKSQDLHCGWDDEFSCHIIDEDKVPIQHVPNILLWKKRCFNSVSRTLSQYQ